MERKGLTKSELEQLKIIQSPVLWAEATLRDPKIPTKPLRLRDYQRNMLEVDSVRKVSRCGRRVGKCVDESSMINTVSGQIEVKSLYTMKEDKPAIITFDEDTMELTTTKNYFVQPNGIKDVYEVTTQTGRKNIVTGNHPFLVIGPSGDTSWIEVDNMTVGDSIAVPDNYEGLIDEVSIGSSNTRRSGYLTAHGNMNSSKVANSIKKSTRKEIGSYLAGYWDCLGWTFLDKDKIRLGATASEERMGRDLQHLLLRLGIKSYLTKREVAFYGEASFVWEIHIIDRMNIEKFIKMVPVEKESLKIDEIRSLYSLSPSPKDTYQGNVAIDKVVSIKHLGPRETYDLTVPETNTFVADDIISHNTLTMCVHIIWYAFTHQNSKQVIATPYDSQVSLIFDMLKDFIKATPELEQSIESSVKSPHHQIVLKNGATIKGFTAGTRSGAAGGSLRGQAADWLYMDEVDYMTDDDFETIYSIALEAPERIGVWISSTPTGRRGKFWACCQPKSGWHEFYYPTMVNPEWSPKMEEELRKIYSEQGYIHEVLAEFGDETIGVFKKEFIDRARKPYHYITQPTKRAIRSIGVDWDKYGAATQIVVTEYNAEEKKIQIINRIEIARGDFTLDNAVNKVIELNQIYQPQMIYIDRGYGEYQVETLRKYGMNHPETELHKRIRPVSFSETKELIDPFTKEKHKKPLKHFMVNQAQILFERDKLTISDYDETIIRQLENYQVIKKTVNGQPVYTSEDEHALDCFMLCILGFVENHPEIIKTIIDYEPAKKVEEIKVKVRNLLEENTISKKNKDYLEDDWDEPGHRPMRKVPLGSKPNRTKPFSWSTRGTNSKKPHKRGSW
jgi:replicative DNA helicase